MSKIKVIFVCLGNICRSPLAEGIMNDYLVKNNLEDKFEIDSAGTAAYHVGNRPDPRSVLVAQKHNIELVHTARQFTWQNFIDADFILVMDQINYEDVLSIASGEEDRKKIFLLRSFDAESTDDFNIVDTYYGFGSDFEDMYDICHRSIVGFVDFIRNQNLL
jgi:protein-tyrosine phosphatase